MDSKDKQKFQQKANDSFKTKLNMYLFSKSLKNELDKTDLKDFKYFSIDEGLVKLYTAEYWQYEMEHRINGGLSNEEIYQRIGKFQVERKEDIENLRMDYYNSFLSETFTIADQFVNRLKDKNTPCEYCKITISQVIELANNYKLFKKNYRGWSLEIDRKDSNYEYTPENCVMACYWCNNAKTDEFTYEEFKEIGQAIQKIWEKRLKNDNI